MKRISEAPEYTILPEPDGTVLAVLERLGLDAQTLLSETDVDYVSINIFRGGTVRDWPGRSVSRVAASGSLVVHGRKAGAVLKRLDPGAIVVREDNGEYIEAWVGSSVVTWREADE